MKNLKTTIALFLSLFILSCSKDDSPKKEYFPTKITTTLPSPTLTGITSINYDDKNRISKFSYQNDSKTCLFEMTYNSENAIETIVSTRTTSSSTNVIHFNCEYTNSKLSKITLTNSTSNSFTNVIYDETQNKYTFSSTTSTPSDYYKYDLNENLIEYTFSGLPMALSYTNNKGIYNKNNNNLPLLFACSINGFEESLYYSYFLASKELSSFSLGVNNHDYEIIRDSENNISNLTMKNTSTGEIVLSATIEYELRTIN